jgi:hypothetical protein
MVAIFGLALLAPFPGRRHGAATRAEPEPDAALQPVDPLKSAATPELARAGASGDDADAGTARVRSWALRTLPPGKLLPDRQPAYVASWVYVFGVATLAALGLAIVSGFVIALGGTDWWHTNPVGHFFNSMHLWSVELFMAFLVIHLWGKFWMAAWRGRRALTWITGVVAFLASIVECFTGYLSQQNFDSQWIATNGKDAFNAAGVSAFFNLMNFGPDAAVACGADPDHPDRAGGRARPDGAGPGRQPSAGVRDAVVRAHQAAHMAGDRQRAARGARCRRGAVARPDPAIRHPEGRHDRRACHPGAYGRSRRRAVLPGRPARDRPELGAGRAGRLPRHRRERTWTRPA